MEIAAARFLTSLYFITTLPVVFNQIIKIPEFPMSDSAIVKLVNEFREEDVNRITGDQIVLSYGKQLLGNNPVPDGYCYRKFFAFVDRFPLQMGTYKKFIALSNEYEPELGIAEKCSSSKAGLIDDFKDAIFETKIWRTLYEFLHANKHPFAPNPEKFRQWIHQLWFKEYPRFSDVIDSSGFEHVFLGERKDDKAIGLHSWLRFHLLERNESQQFDYQGYTVGRYQVMSAVKFRWFNAVKSASSLIIGASPEFELALYTLCFLTRQHPKPCQFELDGCQFTIYSHANIKGDQIFVESSHLFARPFTGECRHHGLQRNEAKKQSPTTVF